MIDIHSHILPGVDDGAVDWDEAIRMAKQAVADGIRTVIATPHHENGRFLNPAPLVHQATIALNHRIMELELDLTVLPGQEVRVYDRLLDDLRSGEVMTLGSSSYLLLELPATGVPIGLEEVIYELSLIGIRTIIAHPERNAVIAANPRVLHQLVECGALGQLTAQSVTGAYGRKLQKRSLQLSRNHLVHLIASDAHDLVRRPFGLSKAYETIGKEFGSEVERYYKTNAESIVADRPISNLDQAVLKQDHRLFAKFFSKQKKR